MKIIEKKLEGKKEMKELLLILFRGVKIIEVSFDFSNKVFSRHNRNRTPDNMFKK